MGLRIVGRERPLKAILSDEEQLAMLAEETRKWNRAKGRTDEASVTAFVEKFQSVRAKQRAEATSGESMLARAERLYRSLREATPENSSPQGKVDVATLLELL